MPQRRVLEDGGHFFPVSRPAAFADAVRGWLSSP
jgi:pimeloyl-ACP methyl ester carboxylesterase